MKNIFNIKSIAAILLVSLLMSCNDFLDREPLSEISPEQYFNEELQLAAYSINLYKDIIPSHGATAFGIYGVDMHTDNMAAKAYDNRYVPGQWKVPQSEDGEWKFTNIFNCNYFFREVLPKWNVKEIAGDSQNIDHYIGEVYFLRASAYFDKLQLFGDFPIIREVLPDQLEPLSEASKRFPRNEVARFIISDLDSAIMLMKKVAPDGRKNRISQSVAQLLKSRVALNEATWLKYFKNTAFVPGGAGWPGSKQYPNYQYPSGSIDNEINYFLDLAMQSAKIVADEFPLTENNGVLQQSTTDPQNDYYDMFCAVDLSGYSEVLLWRQYDKGVWIVHNVPVFAQLGGNGIGLTRGMVDGFLMDNGLPIYAAGTYYAGDDLVSDVRKNRDGRLQLFLKEPGQINVLYPSPEGTHATLVEPYPAILEASDAWTYSTGYAVRKGASFDQAQCGNWAGYTGSIGYRASEAYLNYIEACYERKGLIDNDAAQYWVKLRTRAKVDTDYSKTIAATIMSKEAENDWGAYSAGILVDPTLYNIRRERRCEMMAEGLRYMDLKRWRAMDQMKTTPYHIEGFKLWGPMKNWYGSSLVYGLNDPNSNVSDPSLGDYLRPYEISSRSLVVNGYKWTMAHYLSPIAIQNFLITSGGNPENSPIYQNPGWPLRANEGASDL